MAQAREFKEQEEQDYNEQSYAEEEDRGLTHKRKNKKGVAAVNQAELQEKARLDQEKKEKKAKVVQAPKPKQIKDIKIEEDKNLVEVDTLREPASLVFIGHVDAGKSTICGSIMYHMGVVDRRTIEKFQ